MSMIDDKKRESVKDSLEQGARASEILEDYAAAQNGAGIASG